MRTTASVVYFSLHLCWSLFLTNLQVFKPATLFKRDCNISVFPVKFVKFLGTPILKNIFRQLLLQFLSHATWLESLLDKVASLQSCNLKRLQHRRFPVKFPKFLRAHILKNICELLLLQFLSHDSLFIIYVIGLSTENKMQRRGFIFLQRSKIKVLGKKKLQLIHFRKS